MYVISCVNNTIFFGSVIIITTVATCYSMVSLLITNLGYYLSNSVTDRTAISFNAVGISILNLVTHFICQSYIINYLPSLSTMVTVAGLPATTRMYSKGSSIVRLKVSFPSNTSSSIIITSN